MLKKKEDEMAKLEFIPTPLAGAYIIHSNAFEDERGSFSRIFCKEELAEIFEGDILQINHSVTFKKGSFRGFHFQYPPFCEEKIVKCIKGSIIDIIIDIRKDSKTFLKSHQEVLSSENNNMLFIPKGFAHGFQTLEEDTELLYFHSEQYNPKNEGALSFKDPNLMIHLPLEVSEISPKDLEHPFMDNNFVGVEV